MDCSLKKAKHTKVLITVSSKGKDAPTSAYALKGIKPSLKSLVFMVIVSDLAVLSHSVVSNSAIPWAVDCRPADFSVHGILQARILDWIAIPFSRGSS